VTSLCHSNEVLPPVLAKEKPFFTCSRLAKSNPLTGTLICSFISLVPFLFFVFLSLCKVDSRASLDNRESVHSMAAGKKAFTYGFFRDVDAQGTLNWDCLSKSRHVSFYHFGRGF
jgi:hypothetical protein